MTTRARFAVARYSRIDRHVDSRPNVKRRDVFYFTVAKMKGYP